MDVTEIKPSSDADPVGRTDNVATCIRHLLRPITPNDRQCLIPPILTVEHVAVLLNCSVPWVRGIPATALPRHRIAKRDLYLLDELVAYVRASKRRSMGADELVREVEGEVLGFEPDSERRRPSRRATNASRS